MNLFDTKWWFFAIVALTIMTPIVMVKGCGFKPVSGDYDCNYGARAQDC